MTCGSGNDFETGLFVDSLVGFLLNQFICLCVRPVMDVIRTPIFEQLKLNWPATFSILTRFMTFKMQMKAYTILFNNQDCNLILQNSFKVKIQFQAQYINLELLRTGQNAAITPGKPGRSRNARLGQKRNPVQLYWDNRYLRYVT